MSVTSDETARIDPVPVGPARVPAPEEIDALRVEIDHLDAEILRLVKRRSEVSRLIGAARMAAGGPRIVYNREMAVLARFRDDGRPEWFSSGHLHGHGNRCTRVYDQRQLDDHATGTFDGNWSK